MKSIIEQASSVIKAIEKAWNRAENPDDFSIKIFEHEERNFFGLTSKPAKVGIFFTDATSKTTPPKIKQPVPEKKIEEPSKQPHVKKQPEIKEKIAKTPHHVQTPTPDKIHTQETKEHSPKKAPQPQPTATPQQSTPPKPKATWNTEMVTAASEWIKTALSHIHITHIEFSTEISGKHLRITFTKPPFETPERNKQLFRSFAYLIISSLRNQFKQDVKDLKVVLVTTEQ